ncbi:MAG: transporter substrate-binding domain-containing protein [Desulfobacula sp.]|uniref:substrate-binding periplasmic protein n=1 Tax=Desulfobacula sp. TaxID=2593537 RepID=UPI001D1BE8AF|nr:transporter substrate-binding domain-containing protein [Desulfobacula sp.]MBT4197140.1 transporter substrate-binding domain-containing protein [Desulfobacula sp.]MBT4506367.1 transporter substrate-binding domain-containing protein [Desulfobacula sp.]MBT4875276.1 transporter substrate-binding domain-containing protein [Desulfobacula sp.]MBT5543067.1 transporter substrate-binding domain-containing protein [Desulfobacula sp.]
MKSLNIATVLFFILSSSSIAQTTLTFTTADDQNHNRAKAMNAVLSECFNRMNIRINIFPMPSKRSLINADNGTEDGNFVRTEGITLAYPNLIQVPERISVNQIVAFSKNEIIQIDGWKSLLKYHVVYVNGWRNCERELKNSMATTIVKNENLLFTLLEKNRADVGIFGKSTGEQILKKLGYFSIKALEPPIVTSDLFLYVHKQHGKLIPEIVKTLKLMKKDGTYQNLINQYAFETKPGGKI